MSVESLYATEVRLFEETSLGSGTASGDVIDFPLVNSAAAKTTLAWEHRLDAFRSNRTRTPIHASYRIRTSHEVNPALARWLIRKHAVLTDSRYRIQRIDMPSPTFAMQHLFEDGDLVTFTGCAIDELQISATEGRVVTMELSWHATGRITTGSLQAATTTLSPSRSVSTNESAAAFKTSGDFANRNDARAVFGAELILRRQLEPVQYGPDGQAGAYREAPWEILAELLMPASADTETAVDGQTGDFALMLGDAADELNFIGYNVKAFRPDEPLKNQAFREHSLRFEFLPAIAGDLLVLDVPTGP